MPQKKPIILHVEWVDSVSPSESAWQDREQVEELSTQLSCTSVGLLIWEDKRSLTLAGSWYGDQYHGVMVIPKAAITKRRKIG